MQRKKKEMRHFFRKMENFLHESQKVKKCWVFFQRKSPNFDSILQKLENLEKNFPLKDDFQKIITRHYFFWKKNVLEQHFFLVIFPSFFLILQIHFLWSGCKQNNQATRQTTDKTATQPNAPIVTEQKCVLGQ